MDRTRRMVRGSGSLPGRISLPDLAAPSGDGSVAVSRVGAPLKRNGLCSIAMIRHAFPARALAGPAAAPVKGLGFATGNGVRSGTARSEEHTSELQSLRHLVC